MLDGRLRVRDGGARWERRASRADRERAAKLEAAARAWGGSGALLHVEMRHTGGLYDAPAHAAALAEWSALAGSAPYRGKLEGVPGQSLHGHAVMPLEALPGAAEWYAAAWSAGVPLEALELRGRAAVRSALPALPGGVLFVRVVYRLPKLLAYLAKPADLRACPDRAGNLPTPADLLAACEAYQLARSALRGGRLPRVTFSGNLPRAPRAALQRPADPPAADRAALRLQRAALLSARRSALSARWRPRRPAPGLPACPALPRPVRGRAVRLVGHARPPPIGKPRPGNGPR